MINKFIYFFFLIFISILFQSNSYGNNQFNFDVTELEILENGNIIKGLKKGSIRTNDNIVITSDTFIYNKKKNIFTAIGNVKFKDFNRNVEIFSNKIIYNKNKEIIRTINNSKAIYNKNKIITADNFNYQNIENILNANGNVKVNDKVKNYTVEAENLTYYKNVEKIITKGKTISTIQSKYEISSANVVFFIEENNISSKDKTIIKDMNSQIFYLDEFDYSITDEILKGVEILVITKYNQPKSDKFYFLNGIIDLKKSKFFGKDAEVNIHKTVFDNSDNDPRFKGVSVVADKNLIKVNKGLFTSCKKNDKCPPWSLKAEKIKHNKSKKQITYDNAVLNIYDFPVLYFPKFFHPDPTVNRQSGVLKPVLNSSNILGDSITVPYFKIISQEKDLTISPTIFEDKMIMSQVEYRQKNEQSSLIADFGYVNNYKSSSDKKKKNLYHLFAGYDLDLSFKNYISSDLTMSIERVWNDTYLKTFSKFISDTPRIRPQNFDKLQNKVKLFLDHEKYNLVSGIEAYETVKKTSNDRYQFILPYYNLDWLIEQEYFDGSFNFRSSGSNDLNNTNKLNTNIINDFKYSSSDLISNIGFKTNYFINLKNLNSIGKKSDKYKSSPQVELLSLFNVELSLPLIKNADKYNNILTPKLSFRFNPSDMKDYSTSNNKINANNIFANNRLGLSDTFESGRSITLGLDFKKERKNNLDEINNYFELKLATVFRDKREKFIPKKSSLGEKNSDIFGSIKSQLTNNINLGYNFSVDNDYSSFEYNDINATFSLNNIVTKFSFIEENSEVGDTNVFTNSIMYNYDDQNYFTFKTRRNRKINLTEYYDLVYEYKNDCLTAGIKYNKTYYSDGDLKPSENLLFTITIVPLTSYEYKVDQIGN